MKTDLDIRLSHIDHEYDWIEKYIRTVAEYLPTHSEEELVKFLEEKKVNSADIFLIMQGAKLLYNDRISAPPKKTLIKRI